MRIPRITLLLVTAAALAAGCGSGEDSSADAAAKPAGSKSRGQASEAEPLAVEIDRARPGVVELLEDLKEPEPKPGKDAEFTEKVEYKLREDLLRDAWIDGETTADCPDGVTLKASATSRCTATYEGVEIPYEVTVKDDYKEGAFLIRYETRPLKDLLVAERVYNEFWRNHGEQGGGGFEQKLTCDEMPDALAVDRGADSGYRCRLWTKAGDGDNGRFTHFTVTTDSFGPEFARTS
ncbi:DUF4333 domain-containing protein [Streptomyces sp. TRM68416]|uniref:DUF4333 domain-containing protein n=1 Tax=Streptomyces sp. TRM68416 TaxID=2758412 RepID=UPI001661BBA1|nr:DUF4333 domain-containing protein [Streptomyces sp. TRM68416]MBD0838531.1 hypothetical protein [Streptomyces sp. TRM68416]